jgi:hypothetical protein
MLFWSRQPAYDTLNSISDGPFSFVQLHMEQDWAVPERGANGVCNALGSPDDESFRLASFCLHTADSDMGRSEMKNQMRK